MRNFLGHAGFYRSFIKKCFSKTTKPLTNFLLKDAPFSYDQYALAAFNSLKEALGTCHATTELEPPIREIMCDANASDYAIRAF